MDIKFNLIKAKKKNSNKVFLFVHGSGDNKDGFAGMYPMLHKKLSDHNIVSFSFKNNSESRASLISQIDDLKNIVEFLIFNKNFLELSLFSTSMGAYSTAHLLAKNDFSDYIKNVILYDPADYYLNQNDNDQIYSWNGSDEYNPNASTAVSLIKKIAGDYKIDVVHLTLKNYSESGYCKESFKERGENISGCYPRLNTKMVEAFYDNIPSKNRGRYIIEKKVPHAFMRDGDVESNIKKVTQTIFELIKKGSSEV